MTQAPKTKMLRAILVATFLVSCRPSLASSTHRETTPAGQPIDVTVSSTQYVVGDGAEVRKAAAGWPQGLSFTVDGNHPNVEIRQTPPACGHEIFAYFSRALTSSFHVTPLSTCHVSDAHVDCPTFYVRDSGRLFFHLRYEHRPSRSELSLLAIRRQTNGQVYNVEVHEDQQLAFIKLSNCLQTLVRCPKKEPPCALEAFRQ